jgi:hypothetical protein
VAKLVLVEALKGEVVAKYSKDPKKIADLSKKTKTKYTSALAKTQGRVAIDGDRRKGSTKPDQN